jgi:phospholipid/cholesterol/gamma-HCH transport system permease protein
MRRFASARARGVLALFDLLGDTLIGIVRLPRDRRPEGRSAFGLALQQYGLDSLPIVGLIGLTGGLVLTLLGLKELGKVGVEGMAPKVVGIVVLREIGPLITGIALAGRVASSMAAEIAVSGGNFLVAPRVLALLVAGPLLVAYADALALVGAVAYGTLVMQRPFWPHLGEVWSGLTLKHAIAALVKGAAFGFAVGLCGAWHGRRGRSAFDVGACVRGAVVWAVIAVGIAETLLIFVFKWIRF